MTKRSEKLCPLCAARERAVDPSGTVRPYCRDCTRETRAVVDMKPNEVSIIKRTVKLIELLPDTAAQKRVAQFLYERFKIG